MHKERLFSELALIEELKHTDERFKSYKITHKDPLKIEFRLFIKGYEYIFCAIYPKLFPYQVIIVKKITDFFTGHCYGDGAMCLKWGNDNWSNEITLTMLIKNLIDLLEVENPLGLTHGISESGDEFTLGQRLRYVKKYALIFPYDLMKKLNEFGYVEAFEKVISNDKIYYFLKSIDTEEIEEAEISSEIKKIKYFKTTWTYNDLRNLTSKFIYEMCNQSGSNEKVDVLLISSDFRFMYISKMLDEITEVDVVFSDAEIEKRLPFEKEFLNKKIAILGLGSVGSRVLMDLARAGFKNFFIIDDDIFLPYNSIRHELNLDDCGEYKVEALKRKIEKTINNNVKIEAKTLNFIGQESSTSLNGFFERLSTCEIIIDCTANDNMLMLTNEVVKSENISFVSGAIMPGGLGNVLFVRKRDENVFPSDILSCYYQATADMNLFPDISYKYGARFGEKEYVASMSDCSIIAGLIGKTAISLLSNEDNQVFKDNIYIFSTSNFGDFKLPYNTYAFKANPIPNKAERFDAEKIEKGKMIYENFCATEDN